MTQTIDRIAGLRWLTDKRHAAFESRSHENGFENDSPERWQYAIDTLAPRPWPAQVSEEELDGMPYGIGVHLTHCCADHGCKYGYDDCPVANLRIVQQEHRCEQCYERQERMKKILLDLEAAAIKAFPEDEFTQKTRVVLLREAFVKGAHWAASKEA